MRSFEQHFVLFEFELLSLLSVVWLNSLHYLERTEYLLYPVVA